MLEFDALAKHYSIEPIIAVKELNIGNTSQAKLIVTLDRKYILRKLKDKEQAVTEFLISEVLSESEISPEIVVGNNQEPYYEEGEDIYNLQIFIDNDRNRSINFYELGRTISLFHSRTKNIKDFSEQKDRFPLDEMWKELAMRDEFSSLEFKTELITLVEQCLAYEYKNNCVIHGDLGLWNLLFSDDQIYIIDFGEVRQGNNHFDISAVISSTIDWKKGENEIIHDLTDFSNGYISNFDSFNWIHLKENLSLWNTRGIIALFINQGINENTISYAKLIMKRNKRFESLIDSQTN